MRLHHHDKVNTDFSQVVKFFATKTRISSSLHFNYLFWIRCAFHSNVHVTLADGTLKFYCNL
jgi:hypothetical protein